MRLKVPTFKDTPGLCGPASLKIVLEYYGTLKSERWLADKAGVKASVGTDDFEMVRAAKAAGHDAYAKRGASLLFLGELLKKKIPPIVAWWCGEDAHYSVVCGLTKKRIWLSDPSCGKIYSLPLWAWNNLWFADDKYKHELVVVFPIQKVAENDN